MNIDRAIATLPICYECGAEHGDKVGKHLTITFGRCAICCGRKTLRPATVFGVTTIINADMLEGVFYRHYGAALATAGILHGVITPKALGAIEAVALLSCYAILDHIGAANCFRPELMGSVDESGLVVMHGLGDSIKHIRGLWEKLEDRLENLE